MALPNQSLVRSGLFPPQLLQATAFFFLALSSALVADEPLTRSEPRPMGDGGSMVTFRHPQKAPAEPVDLLIHFHGAPSAAAENFVKSGRTGVLAVVNFKGLSAAYVNPFQKSDTLFDQLIRDAAKDSGVPATEGWKTITVSSFSAGYGAVRTLLKKPENFKRIDALIAADSMYASLEKGTDSRQPLKTHMKDYLRFAKLAAEDKKIFLITHTAQETPYASTTETADYLLQSLDINRRPHSRRESETLLFQSKTTKGGLTVLGFEGISGQDHLEHLRQIHRWWRQAAAAATE